MADNAGTPSLGLRVTTSWDDGYPSDIRVADLLEKHGLKGTFYVPSVNSEGRPVMRPADVARLDARFEIGGHTRSHVVLTKLPPNKAAREIASNKARLEDLLGHEITGFAYVRGRHNRQVRRLVEEAGYRYARTTENLANRRSPDPFRLPTTAQFYPHAWPVLLRNYLRRGPSLSRAIVLAGLLRSRDLLEGLAAAASRCAVPGGAFHLWGHSWELDEHALWGTLDRLLGRLSALCGHAETNAEWCGGPPAAAERWRRTPLPRDDESYP